MCARASVEGCAYVYIHGVLCTSAGIATVHRMTFSLSMRPERRAKVQQEAFRHATRRLESGKVFLHFLRFVTFEHISIRPTLASLSGNPDIARAARST